MSCHEMWGNPTICWQPPIPPPTTKKGLLRKGKPCIWFCRLHCKAKAFYSLDSIGNENTSSRSVHEGPWGKSCKLSNDSQCLFGKEVSGSTCSRDTTFSCRYKSSAPSLLRVAKTPAFLCLQPAKSSGYFIDNGLTFVTDTTADCIASYTAIF